MKILTGGEIWVDGGLLSADLAFDEHIEGIGRDFDGTLIDCSGKIILPGMIDPHVHFRDFDEAYKEDWQSASAAAAKGGITTVLEMPNTSPTTTNLDVIKEKKRRIEASAINGGIYGGILPETIKDIPKIAPHVAAFKLYMGMTTGGMIISKPDLQKEIFQRVAETEKVLAVHAQRLESNSEALDIEIVLELALKTHVKLYLCHVRTQEGVELANDAKRDGLDITIETCPHYLFFTDRDVESKGAWLKVNPPITTQGDQEYLWDALNSNVIDTLGSDHAPHTIEEKSVPIGAAPFGLPGVEFSLPLMLDAVNKDRISLEKLIELFSENPAKRFGLSNKAKIEKGLDADLVVIDMNRIDQINNENILTKCGWSHYGGFELTGWPIMTFVGGQLVYQADRTE
jgi:dihydroorotase